MKPLILEAVFSDGELAFVPVIQGGAAPTWVGWGTLQKDANPHADFTVALPTHQTDDIFLLMVLVRGQTDTITVSGWTAITGSPWDRGSTSRYWLWWKRAASASETNPTVDFSGTAGDAYAIAAAYRGAITTEDPWEVKGTLTTGTADPAVLTGITTATADSLVVVPLGGEDNNNASIITTGTDPAAYTEHYVETPIGGDAMFGFSEAARATAGATGNVSVDFSNAVPVGWGGVVLALKPAPAAAPFTPEFNAFRFYEDGTESGSTPWAAQDTDVTVNVTGGDQQIHLRVRIDETGGGTDGGAADTWGVEYSRNSGAWTQVTDTSSYVKADSTSGLTNDDPTTNRASNGISDPVSGSFVAGIQEEQNAFIGAHQLTKGDFTEHVFALLVIATDVSNGDTLDFRMELNAGGPGMTNNVEPTITVQVTAATGVGWYGSGWW